MYQNEEDYNSNKFSNIISLNQIAPSEDSRQIYLRPDLSSALIELVKFYNWTEIYYIFNSENGKIFSLNKYKFKKL